MTCQSWFWEALLTWHAFSDFELGSYYLEAGCSYQPPTENGSVIKMAEKVGSNLDNVALPKLIPW
jgi:hypothetical protein